VISLTQHILASQRLYPEATGDFSAVMTQIVLAAKKISRDLRQAGLADILGSTGEVNVQGEEVQKLDQMANDTFVQVFEQSSLVKTVVSEEMEEPYLIARAVETGKYALFFDPLDGSSNVDVNAPLATIFSMHRLTRSSGKFSVEDVLHPGSAQVAAGYVLYGSSTLLMYTCGSGTHQFTLDPTIGEFFLSARNLKMPDRGKIYSVNDGNYEKWSRAMQSCLDHFQTVDVSSRRPYTSRYTGCLAADVHRVLCKGGLYLYPGEVNKPEGKLRLMYEAAPLTFLIEQAGGIGSTGFERIAQIQPKSPHQRVPLVIGSKEDVEFVERTLQTGNA